MVLVRGGQLREADRAARCRPHDALCQQEVAEQGCHQQILQGTAGSRGKDAPRMGLEAGTVGNPDAPGHQRQASSSVDPDKTQQAA